MAEKKQCQNSSLWFSLKSFILILRIYKQIEIVPGILYNFQLQKVGI
jgi:hypothetical protein